MKLRLSWIAIQQYKNDHFGVRTEECGLLLCMYRVHDTIAAIKLIVVG